MYCCICIAREGLSSAETGSFHTQCQCVTANPMRVALSYHSETDARVKVISQMVHDNITTSEYPNPVFLRSQFSKRSSRARWSADVATYLSPC